MNINETYFILYLTLFCSPTIGAHRRHEEKKMGVSSVMWVWVCVSALVHIMNGSIAMYKWPNCSIRFMQHSRLTLFWVFDSWCLPTGRTSMHEFTPFVFIRKWSQSIWQNINQNQQKSSRGAERSVVLIWSISQASRTQADCRVHTDTYPTRDSISLFQIKAIIYRKSRWYFLIISWDKMKSIITPF